VRLLENNHRQGNLAPGVPFALVNKGTWKQWTGRTWATRTRATRTRATRTRATGTGATGTRATRTRATRTEGNWNEGDRNEGDSNEGDSNEGDSNEGDSNKGNCNKGDWNKGDYNIGSYNRGNDLCGLFNTDGGCVIFNKYTKTKHTEIEKMKGYSLLAECIFEKKLPEKEELAEIEKLPNFDEAVMRELILGKGDKK
jgi:PPE-repeat protein